MITLIRHQVCVASQRSTIQADSLLEYLYTYFSLEQLIRMVAEHPRDAILNLWGVAKDDYQLMVLRAMDFVARD